MRKGFILASSLGLLLFGAVNQQGAGQGQPAEKHAAHFLKCAEECNKCQQACDSCATHCAKLLAQGKKHHLVTLQTCLDCSVHCSAAATIVARQGPFSDTICKACAEACARCAKECEKHDDDATMKQCAAACRSCERACRDMLTHVSGTKPTERRE